MTKEYMGQTRDDDILIILIFVVIGLGSIYASLSLISKESNPNMVKKVCEKNPFMGRKIHFSNDIKEQK